MRDDFCVMILSHQRPDRIYTLDALRKAGYTGDVYIVVDDQDPMLDAYREAYEDQLIVFSKDEIDPKVDTADAEDGQDVVVYARQAAWEIAADLGVEYYCVMDDDYDWFRHRIGPRGEYLHAPPWIENMDAVLEAFMQYMDKSPHLVNVAFSQGGDWIGGEAATDGIEYRRKAMNAHLLKVDRPFRWMGRVNEDTTAYVVHGNRGRVFLTYMPTALNQKSTQQQEGGLTDAYLRLGTYTKSFYTVLYAPSCTRVTMMGEKHRRPHHEVSWNRAVPKIVPQEYRKSD